MIERLLELAGIKLDEDMTVDQARMVFMQAGASAGDLSNKAALKSEWIKLQREFQPDVGRTPNGQKMALINAAYDVLKKTPNGNGNGSYASDDAETYAVWGWDGRLMIPGYQIAATPQQFPEVAQTALQRMRQGFKIPRAIFLQKKEHLGSRIYLIYKGQPINPPAEYLAIGEPQRDPSLQSWIASYA